MGSEEMSRREDDIKLLKEILELDPSKRDSRHAHAQREVFAEMLAALESGERHMLSEKQREWAQRVADIPGEYKNLVSEGRVPRGREVPTPPVLQNRPLKPPGRR